MFCDYVAPCISRERERPVASAVVATRGEKVALAEASVSPVQINLTSLAVAVFPSFFDDFVSKFSIPLSSLGDRPECRSD